ncbi:type VI secretion system Vgr family protein [Granulicella paludicola]|uniref:type VI secretion system Vgr family protein n=1 Tax=Granulicella paludicola TaxID=474951 RepID=UPI0021DFE815|nr:type VI secretion system tip protein TssI/VgrG [Granulicella paludicola]
MPTYKQADRLMQITTVLEKDLLLIQSLEGVEGLSRLFDFQVELLAEIGTDIDPSTLIATKATVAIALLSSQGSRYVHGVIAALEQTSGDDNFDVYRAHIVPSLWQLTLSVNCRVFQDKTPMDIIKDVIAPYALTVSDKTESTGQTLDYCTQYNETDFNFISRVAEQYGIFYWFEHKDGDNVVVFGNSREGYDSNSQTLNYAPQADGNQDLYQPVINDIRATAAMVTGRHSYRDYDPHGRVAIVGDPVESAQPAGKNALERYEFPSPGTSAVKKLSKDGSRKSDAYSDPILKYQLDASDVNYNTFHGVSTARTMFPGGVFEMAMHPRDAWNSSYLLTEVAHYAVQVPSYLGSEDAALAPYSARFAAIESERLFRPAARTPKPRVAGPQSGIVVTPSGEDLYVDEQGRVCVQFFWDRERQADTIDNTWVRVAQPWAGSGWGTYFWPRKNDEVLIQFLNGDPDAPVVIGSVYNAVNMPKYKLPDMSTMTGVLTRSSKGGGASNANELRFEDKKGSEEIYINAEKDMNVNVENDNYRNVGNNEVVEVKQSRWMTVDMNQTTVVKGTLNEAITGDTSLKISGALKEKIEGDTDIAYGGKLTEKTGGDYAMNVGGNHNEKVGSVYVVDSGQEVHIKGGMKVVIESGMELCLQGAGGFITIGPAGVAISGTMVLINSGGAAVPGTPAVVTDPQDPVDPTPPPGGSWRENS